MGLERFLRAAGVADLGQLGNRDFAQLAAGLQTANQGQRTIERFLLNYLDPKTFAGNASELDHVLSGLNAILILDGVQVRFNGSTPNIDMVQPALTPGASPPPRATESPAQPQVTRLPFSTSNFLAGAVAGGTIIGILWFVSSIIDMQAFWHILSGFWNRLGVWAYIVSICTLVLVPVCLNLFASVIWDSTKAKTSGSAGRRYGNICGCCVYIRKDAEVNAMIGGISAHGAS